MIERYTLPEMGALWSQHNKFQKWLDVEVALAQAEADLSIVPQAAADEIAHLAVLPFALAVAPLTPIPPSDKGRKTIG